MRKIFTFVCAAVLSIGAWADEATLSLNGSAVMNPSNFFTVAGSYNTKFNGATYATIEFTQGLKMDSKGSVSFTTTELSTVTIVQSSSSGGDKTIKLDDNAYCSADATSTGTGYYEYVIANVAAGEHTIVKGSGEVGLFYVKVEWTTTPSTDPVINAQDASIKTLESGTEVTENVAVTGANLTGSTLTATLNPAVEGLSVTLDANTISDGAISTNAVLHYTQTVNINGTTTLTLSDGTTSKEVTITYQSRVVASEPQAISTTTTWDFSTLSGGLEFSGDDLNTEYAYSDLFEITCPETFNAACLAFKGQFPFRGNSNKYAQNGILHFKTTVAGTVKVSFSDTGTGASATAVKRYLVINSDTTEYWTSRAKTGDGAYDAQLNVTSGEIAVPAGDVTISGTSAIVVSKIVFTKSETTPIDNAEVGEKAVKMIENGQLVIKRDGKTFNVLGTVVK